VGLARARNGVRVPQRARHGLDGPAGLAWSTRWRWPALIAGVLAIAAIGLSRLYLGVHYPSDVLGAWAAALAWVIGLRLVLLARASARPVASGSSL